MKEKELSNLSADIERQLSKFHIRLTDKEKIIYKKYRVFEILKMKIYRPFIYFSFVCLMIISSSFIIKVFTNEIKTVSNIMIIIMTVTSVFYFMYFVIHLYNIFCVQSWFWDMEDESEYRRIKNEVIEQLEKQAQDLEKRIQKLKESEEKENDE